MTTGRGYIRQRSAGTWAITVSAGFDEAGRRKQLYATVRGTKRQAQAELTRLLREVDTGTFADSGSMTVAQYFDRRWLPHIRTRVRPAVGSRYADLFRLYIAPVVGTRPLAKVRPAQVQAVVDHAIGAGLAARTTVQAYRVLHAALGQAVRWQLLAVNPAAAVRPPRPERAQLTIPDGATVNRLLEAANDRLRVPLVIAATTGLRRGEVLGLRWGDVDLDGRLFRVTVAAQEVGDAVGFVEPKTDRARRTVALPAVTVRTLREHRREQAARRLLAGEAWCDLDLVCDRGDGGFIHPDVISRAFQRLTVRLGVPGVRLHDLRHFVATEMLKANVHPKVVSEALGHASVAFTMDVYSHLLPSMQQEAARAMDAVFATTATSD